MFNTTVFRAVMQNTTTGEIVVLTTMREAIEAEKNGFKLIRCSGKNF